jgi:hypothetical protein
MSDICGNTLGNRPRGLAGTLGNVPSGSPLLFGHFPKHICYSVRVAKKVSNTLWAFPKESPILFTYFSNGLHELLDTCPSESRQFGHFLYISHEAAHFCFLRLKIEDSIKNVKNISGSSTDYSPSNHTTFSQTQTDATLPLIKGAFA